MFKRPDYKPGMIVLLPETNRHMVIQQRRKVRPNGLPDRQWVYDGAIIEGKADGSIRRCTGISCVLEDSIERIPMLS